jgi:hypothetical protein
MSWELNYIEHLVMFIFVRRVVKDYGEVSWVKITYMNSSNYLDTIIKQSQEKFSLMKEKMLEPIKQVQQARKESLRNLLTEIEKKQNLFQEKRVSLEKLCQE